ncbi:MAG: hypothetical protein ABJB76_08750 [Candidatus Nitrosocosmicus sp.]
MSQIYTLYKINSVKAFLEPYENMHSQNKPVVAKGYYSHKINMDLITQKDHHIESSITNGLYKEQC